MPKLSSTAPAVPPCLSPESAPVWARLRNYVRHAQRRTLLVIRHDSPRLPRELPPLLAEESGRPLVTATVSDAEPDPMAAAIHAAPGGNFPAGCILTITGAEDLALKSDDDSRAALFEFARRLDLRRDQFLPEGGIVIVWAIPRVFDALAEHSLNFISRAAAVLTLNAEGERGTSAVSVTPLISSESMRGRYRLPPLPLDAPAELRASIEAFEELAVANELYLQGGPHIAHALARFDAARDAIKDGWEVARRWSELDPELASSIPASDATRDFAEALLIRYPDAGFHMFHLRHRARERIVWLNTALAAARRIAGREEDAARRGNPLAAARAHDARGAEGSALGSLGIAWADLGDAHKAISYHEQHLAVARKMGDRWAEGNALGNLGLAWAALGDTRKAIGYYEGQLVIALETGDRQGEGNALGSLGVAWAALGNAHKAIGYHEQYLSISREIGDRRGEGNALGNLGLAWAALGDARRAIGYYEQVLAIFREIGDRRGEGNALWNLAVALELLNNRTEALARAAAALLIFEDIEYPTAANVRATMAKWRGE